MLPSLLAAVLLVGSPATTTTTSATVAAPTDSRNLNFPYRVIVDAPPADSGAVDVFVHPYVEVGGKPYMAMTKTYSFKEVAPEPKDG